MTREAQRQQTFNLVALRDIDRSRAESQRLIDAVPRVLKSRRAQIEEARQNVEAARHKHQGFRTHLKSLELELSQREENLSKANANLLTAKTNQEYSLLMGEISRRKEEKGQAEEAIIEQYDVIKQGERLVAEAQAGLEAAEQDFAGFEERAQSELREHEAELARFDERREQIRKAISPDVLKIYDRAYQALGEGVVPVEGNVCQGCFGSVTTNDRSRLLSGLELITCRSCQRILYLPAVLQASPT